MFRGPDKMELGSGPGPWSASWGPLVYRVKYLKAKHCMCNTYHVLMQASRYCDRFCWIKSGKVAHIFKHSRYLLV